MFKYLEFFYFYLKVKEYLNVKEYIFLYKKKIL